MLAVPAGGWIALTVGLLLGGSMIAGAVALWRVEGRKRRIRLPARLVEQTFMPPGAWLTVEFPGPDGEPRRSVVFSAVRRGLGATPMFQGWVWVDRDDPSDVIVRPRARSFWPVFLTVAGSVLLTAGVIVALVLWADAALRGMGAQG